MKVIVTMLEEETDTPRAVIRKKLLDRAKGCVRPGKSIEEIDADIQQMRR